MELGKDLLILHWPSLVLGQKITSNKFYLVHPDHHSDVEPFPSVFLSPLRDFAVSVQAAAKDNKIITDNKSPVVISL